MKTPTLTIPLKGSELSESRLMTAMAIPPRIRMQTSQSQDLLDLQSDPNQLASLVARFNASVASGFQSTIDNSTQNEGLVKEGRQSRYAAEAIAEYNANQHVEERNHFTTVLGIDVYA